MPVVEAPHAPLVAQGPPMHRMPQVPQEPLVPQVPSQGLRALPSRARTAIHLVRSSRARWMLVQPTIDVPCRQLFCDGTFGALCCCCALPPAVDHSPTHSSPSAAIMAQSSKPRSLGGQGVLGAAEPAPRAMLPPGASGAQGGGTIAASHRRRVRQQLPSWRKGSWHRQWLLPSQPKRLIAA